MRTYSNSQPLRGEFSFRTTPVPSRSTSLHGCDWVCEVRVFCWLFKAARLATSWNPCWSSGRLRASRTGLARYITWRRYRGTCFAVVLRRTVLRQDIDCALAEEDRSLPRRTALCGALQAGARDYFAFEQLFTAAVPWLDSLLMRDKLFSDNYRAQPSSSGEPDG